MRTTIAIVAAALAIACERTAPAVSEPNAANRVVSAASSKHEGETVEAKEIRAKTVRAKLVYAEEVRAKKADVPRIERVPGFVVERSTDKEINGSDVTADIIYAKEIVADEVKADVVYAREVHVGE